MKKLNESILENLTEAVDNKPVDVIVSGDLTTFKNRKEAKDFFLLCMQNSEGSELGRYATVYSQLADGEDVAVDNWDETDPMIRRVSKFTGDHCETVKELPGWIKYSEYKKKDKKLKEDVELLTEAPEDETEYEIADEVETETEIPEEAPVEEELSDEEIKDEAEEDEKETVEADEEQPFYAADEKFDELRDRLIPLDYRLFLINGELICIGRLNGADVEVLTSNRPDTAVEVSDTDERAEEIEKEAEEDGEDAFEYKWIKRPATLNDFLNQVNVLYLSPDISDEDKEQYAGLEASHESVLNFLDKELEDANIKPDKEEVEETETEEDIEETEIGDETND